MCVLLHHLYYANEWIKQITADGVALMFLDAQILYVYRVLVKVVGKMFVNRYKVLCPLTEWRNRNINIYVRVMFC